MQFSELARMRRRIWRRLFDPTRGRGTTQLNVLRTFPQFRPYSAGAYKDKSNIAIQTINRTFPSLSSFSSSLRRQSLEIKPIKKFPQSNDDLAAAAQIKELLETRVRPAVAMDGGDITFEEASRTVELFESEIIPAFDPVAAK